MSTFAMSLIFEKATSYPIKEAFGDPGRPTPD